MIRRPSNRSIHRFAKALAEFLAINDDIPALSTIKTPWMLKKARRKARYDRIMKRRKQ